MLLDEFGSIMGIGAATSNELCALDGIGNVLAKRIHDTLNKEEKMEL